MYSVYTEQVRIMRLALDNLTSLGLTLQNVIYDYDDHRYVELEPENSAYAQFCQVLNKLQDAVDDLAGVQTRMEAADRKAYG